MIIHRLLHCACAVGPDYIPKRKKEHAIAPSHTNRARLRLPIVHTKTKVSQRKSFLTSVYNYINENEG